MLRRRRSIRLKGYDYSIPGAYFITIRTQDRTCVLGEVVSDEVRLTDAGHMVAEVWQGLPDRFRGIDLDAFIVMPNHVHGIIMLVGAGLVPALDAGLVPAQATGATTRVAHSVGDVAWDVMVAGAGRRGDACVAPTMTTGAGGAGEAGAGRTVVTVGDVVGAFKSLTTVRYVRGVRGQGWPRVRERLWQRNYYEHIVRCPESLDRLRRYVFDNPRRWLLDPENRAGLFSVPTDPWLVMSVKNQLAGQWARGASIWA